MDPQYSVLLEDENAQDCLVNSKKKGVNILIIAIVVPVVVTLIAIVGLLIYFYPK